MFDDKVLSGENVEIDDFTFIITMNKYASAIFVDAGDMYQSVQLYKCKDMESFRICFKNTTYDEEENELYAEVNITRAKPDVSITRTMNQTDDLYVGNEIEVTITIENTGDTAPNIEMTDDYPANFEIYDMEGRCREHENQVYLQGHLDEDEKEECTFIIRPTEETHRSFVAHLKYWNWYRWEEEYSSTLTLDIEPVLEVMTSLVREDYEVDGRVYDWEEDNPGIKIGETPRLLVNITNNYDEDININAMEIHLPEDIQYRSTGHLRFNYKNASGDRASNVWYSDRISRISDRLLRWDGGINEKDSKLFIIKLEAQRTGDQNIIINTEYEYEDDLEDLIFKDTITETMRVTDPGIAIRMTLDDDSRLFSAPERLDQEEDSTDIEALHPYRLKIYTQNKNKFAKLKDVNIEVLTELAGFKKVHYDLIDEEGQKIPYSFVLIPPGLESSKTFETNVSISYENEYGERHYNSTEFDITVQPSKDITIEWDSSEGEVLESGEETEIKVSVNNDRLVDIRGVSVTDTIPPELHVEGVHSNKGKLIKEEETEMYTYRITPPILHKETKFNITTKVSFFDPDYRRTINITETNTITVEPLRPDISVDITLDEPDEIYPGTLIPVEYRITNDEEEEIVRDIKIHFPIQEEIDLIGPKTFLIDKLDPGEEVTLKDLIRIRPKKANRSLEWNITRIDYKDNYGNSFHENSSDESIEVESARINGPALYLRTIVPEVINKSTEDTIRIQVINEGNAPADVTVQQGDRIWNTSVAAQSTGYADYKVVYDQEGNYTIPDPYATFRFQGLEAHTKGTGATAKVELILPPPEEEIEEEEVIVEEKEEIIPEKEEMSFEQYEEQQRKRQMQAMMRYGLAGLIVIIMLIIVAAYIGYQRRKGPSEPFMEEEGGGK